ncbi:Met18p Ecym_5405 [Eremothecium cymbalariae DBVPG|uniref:MMS19 nucleotide excision repair protein n=1 Tax=Eremothecium cymbalariae (strain CBS 270.75 / DBVPG 7215 / KCTC 17166 / NRRL Y-17582) TaxID=931890 RepID=I6NDL8_ERECY|nr:hypothetical protein Ecym_5405 [Eremothecium cymbalariae DBVPG\
MAYTTEQLHGDIVSLLANVDINNEHTNKLARKIANAIDKQMVKLLEVVISLRDYMTSEDDGTRLKSMRCLSSILANLGETVLMKNDVLVVFEFYKNRTDDSACLEEIFHGISSLVKMRYFSSGQIMPLLNILKDQYQPSSHLAATRYLGFKILDNLLQRFHTVISNDKLMNDYFIRTFILLANGEKDPKNLLLSFSLNSDICKMLQNIDSFKEDLFDILFCYFPITFKPPKNDPYKISTEDLKLSLRNAISSTPTFAEDAFANLVDKMTASSPSVKNDTILTLKMCIKSSAAEKCIENWLPIWQALKFEIMNNNDTEDPAVTQAEFNNYKECLSVISVLAEKFLSFGEAVFDKFYSHIFDELKPNFDYEKDLKQSCGILSSIASVNATSFNKVMDNVLPSFFSKNEELDIPKQRLLILNLSFFFDAYIKVFGETGKAEHNHEVTNNKLLGHKDEIIMVLGKALTSSKVEVSLRTLSIIEFTELVKMNGYLTHEEGFMIVQYLTETILTDDNKNIYIACLEGLKVISEHYEDIIREVLLKQLLELLPNEPAVNQPRLNDEQINLDTVLKVIVDFTSTTHKLVKESVIGILEKLCTVAKMDNSEDYCFMFISCLHTLLSSNIKLFDIEHCSELKNIVYEKLLDLVLNCNSIYENDHNLIISSSILWSLNLKSDKITHQEELEKQVKWFVQDKNIINLPSRSAVVFLNILSGLDKKCEFPENVDLLKNVVSLLRNPETNITSFEKLAYLQLISLLINKWCDDESVDGLIYTTNRSTITLEIMAWAAKGLVMKNSPFAVKYLDLFMELLQVAEYSASVTPLFEILVLDTPIFRTVKGISWNHNVRLLYKQKLFSYVAVKLVDGFKATTDMKIKSNYLTALSLILRNTPADITITYISELLPLLLQALELKNSDVRVSSLQTLMDTIEQNSQLVAQHIHSLVPQLLQLIHQDNYNSVTVRLLSLRMLRALTYGIPLNYLLPFKEDIVTGLVVALGDKKRVVRKQCIDTRQSYYELGRVVQDS